MTFEQSNPNVYQSVSEKTRSIASRTTVLVQAMDNHQAEDEDGEEEAEEADAPAGDDPETPAA